MFIDPLIRSVNYYTIVLQFNLSYEYIHVYGDLVFIHRYTKLVETSNFTFDEQFILIDLILWFFITIKWFHQNLIFMVSASIFLITLSSAFVKANFIYFTFNKNYITVYKSLGWVSNK